ncbi:hypothetical protein SCAR479_08305 [Seiridium cardinale]|uniref:Uncharacterized protein n=1 Tax=Seiridium cardinale TaxID=138064 RepID=A0ABR2XN60_9PEZI
MGRDSSDGFVVQIGITYNTAITTVTVGRGAALHGDLVVADERLRICPSAVVVDVFVFKFDEPNFENFNEKQVFEVAIRGGGYRYNVAESVRRINAKERDGYCFRTTEARAVGDIIGRLERASSLSRVIMRVSSSRRM